MINKCPYCSSPNFFKIDTSNPNSKYVLTEVNPETQTFHATSGMPVDAYGCLDCKGIMLINEKLQK